MPTVDEFVLSKYRELHDGIVLSAHAEGEHVRITRSEGRPLKFGVVKQLDVTATDIAQLLDNDTEFVVNIPRAGIFQADAIELCRRKEVAWEA